MTRIRRAARSAPSPRQPKLDGHSLFGTIGTPGTGDGQFSDVGGIALDFAGNLYVADIGNHRIQVFNSSLSFTRKWGSFGSADGQFREPVSVDVDRTGNVYVADRGNRLIKKFTPSGSFSRSWAPTGSTADLRAVAVDDAADKVYVVSTFTIGSSPIVRTRIEKLSSSGVSEDATTFEGVADYVAASDDQVMITGEKIGFCRFDSNLNVDDQCNNINTYRGVSFDPAGSWYMGRFNEFDKHLFTQTDETGGVGRGIGEGTGNAAAVAADPFGNVVVVVPNGQGDRIQKWWQKF